jgi:hypothetical protein
MNSSRDLAFRLAITQCVTGDTFRALVFRVADSICYRLFCRLSPLQSVVRPPLLTHIAQVYSSRTFMHLVNSKPLHRLA